MKRIGLLVWSVGLAVSASALLRGVRWPGTADAPAAVMSGVRVVAGGLAAYLLVSTLVAVLAETTQSAGLATVGRWLTTAGVRRLVAGVVGGGLLLAPVDVGAEVREPPPSEAPVLRRLPDTTEPAHEPAPAAPPSAGEQPGEVVVSPGDHLWAIAERTLAARLGRAPSDAEIVPFWRALIELNRDRLRTGDPDLIFVGDRFVLPS